MLRPLLTVRALQSYDVLGVLMDYHVLAAEKTQWYTFAKAKNIWDPFDME